MVVWGGWVPKKEDERPKLFSLLQTESVIMARTRIWGNNRGGHPPRESGAVSGKPTENECTYSSEEELGKSFSVLSLSPCFLSTASSLSVSFSQFRSPWFLFLGARSHNQPQRARRTEVSRFHMVGRWLWSFYREDNLHMGRPNGPWKRPSTWVNHE